MLNRKLEVDLVKKNSNKQTVLADELAFETRAIFVTKLIDESVQKVMIGVFGYVILDTVRKVIIASASKGK